MGRGAFSFIATLTVASAAFVAVAAQSSRPTFEVASVKQNIGTAGGRLEAQAGGRFVATGQTVRSLIQWAYGLVDPQIVDGPDWLRSTKFDITAKAQDEATDAQIRIMVQSLLESRFQLKARRDQRELPVQEVTLNRSDGRLGSRLVQVASQADCKSAAESMPKNERPSGAIVAMFSQCGALSPILTRMVYSQMRTMAVDKTGLTGSWYVSIVFAPEGASNPRQFDIDPNIPTFVTALQDQLGLKLRSARGLVDVLTIESVHMPTPD